jgi:PAS domain S-box-containing protein
MLVLYYQSSEELRENSLEQFRQETEKRATSMGFFFAEQKDDFINLVNSREIDVFFENKSLGMSMEYGLKLSLPPIAQRFDELIGKKKFEKDALYERLVLIDKKGSCLVDTNPEKRQGKHWKSYLDPHYRNEPTILLINNEIIISVAYFFKGQHEAQLVAWINRDVIARRLLGEMPSEKDMSWLVFKDTRPPRILVSIKDVAPVYLQSFKMGETMPESGKPTFFTATTKEGDSQDWIYLSVVVPGTALELIREVQRKQVLGRISTSLQLAVMISVALLILGVGLINVFLNIKTQKLRRNLEEAMQREVDVYKTLAEKSFTGVFVIQDGLFTYITENAANYYGCDVAALVGTKPERIVFPGDYINMHTMAVDMIKGKRNAPYEYRIITKDNKIRWIMETVSPISFNGRQAVLGNCIDITERRQREVQELHSQKLESVGQLAAGIAHEINTPIQFVGDNIHFMKGAFQDILSLSALLDAVTKDSVSDPEIARNLLSQIRKKEQEIDLDFLKEEVPQAIEQSLDGLQRVSKIVMAMREFSHPGGEGKTDLDVNKAIESTLTLSRNEWKYSAELTTNLTPDLPVVQGYPADFNQVILNIIVNAAQALQEKVEKDGQEKERIEISTRQDGDEVEICIRDTGPGIPPEAQSRVFDPFFTTKEVGKGTGQGLAIAQNIIVHKHGGKIYFETKPGEGTTFYIRLPLKTEQE